MDSPNSKTDEKWVEDRLASLTPPDGWRPNTDRALESLLQQRSSSTSRAVRLSMAGLTVAVIAAVLMLLPWHVLWTPKANEPSVAAQLPAPPQPTNPEPAQSDPVPQSAPAERVSTPSDPKDPVNEESTQKAAVPPKAQDNPPTNPTQEERRPKKNRPIIAADVEPLSEAGVPQAATVSIQGQDSGPMSGYQGQLTELKKQLAEMSLTLAPQNSKVQRVQAQIKELEGRMRLAQNNPQPAPPSNVTAPVLLSQVQPPYTPEAKEARVQGTIEILATVRTDGTVKVEKVTQGLGYGLDEAAVTAVEQWKFSPGTVDGKPVAVMTTIRVNFSLR